MGYKTRTNKKWTNKKNKSKKNGGGMFDIFNFSFFGKPKSEAMKALDIKEKECIDEIKKQKDALTKLEQQKEALASQGQGTQGAKVEGSQDGQGSQIVQTQNPMVKGGRKKSRRNKRKSRR